MFFSIGNRPISFKFLKGIFHKFEIRWIFYKNYTTLTEIGILNFGQKFIAFVKLVNLEKLWNCGYYSLFVNIFRTTIPLSYYAKIAQNKWCKHLCIDDEALTYFRFYIFHTVQGLDLPEFSGPRHKKYITSNSYAIFPHKIMILKWSLRTFVVAYGFIKFSWIEFILIFAIFWWN